MTKIEAVIVVAGCLLSLAVLAVIWLWLGP